jgi:mitochondrial fission process protein 1
MNLGKSRAFPALTIHTVVKQTKKAFDKSTNPRLRAWGPTFTGLAIVPALPYIFDHPVEEATDRAFEWIKQRLAPSDKETAASVD